MATLAQHNRYRDRLSIYINDWVGKADGKLSALITVMGVVVIYLSGKKSITRPENSVNLLRSDHKNLNGRTYERLQILFDEVPSFLNQILIANN